MKASSLASFLGSFLIFVPLLGKADTVSPTTGRSRTSLNDGWRFWRSEFAPDGLSYDFTVGTPNDTQILKPWILPSGNAFLSDPASAHIRPPGNIGGDVPYVQQSFDDKEWEVVRLPHDWAIKGPFYEGPNSPIGGGMGRLPSQGVGWYRRTLFIPRHYEGKRVYIDVDGAMSHSAVWLNGQIVGGWPYGYNSFRLDLTPYVKYDSDNQLSIRLENQPSSSRWYPGAGIYRNVWLTVVDPIHVSQWGTYVTSRNISKEAATVDVAVVLQNDAKRPTSITVKTELWTLDEATGKVGQKVARLPPKKVFLDGQQKSQLNGSVILAHPRLWGPPPSQQPHLYVAITELRAHNRVIDKYETIFGVRSLEYDANHGLLVNGERVMIQGVNLHSDLGALGRAWNARAGERQLQMLAEMGVNAIRMSHNPPAPEMLAMTDRMGFLVLDEIFDCWRLKKTDNDFHLIFDDWHEQDLRAFIRRDRNHPSVISWSFGNEVGEQTTGESGAELATRLRDILREEDHTRPSSASKNAAAPGTPFPAALDMINLNYQGSGIRDTEAYSGLQGIRTYPRYPDFHAAYPDKLILGSETASAVSSRGVYLFPVTHYTSAPANDTSGGSEKLMQVSSYELYSTPPGSSADKVFTHQDKNPYVAGEFVWTGFDYLGEPAPYYSARSSYFGIIDLAGFKKDRYWIYQSRWRPDLPIAHILPHWTWPDRVGEVTPVHVFSEADEAELFLNGDSQGRRLRGDSEYRFRWDNITYEPGELQVVTYRDGQEWARDMVRTTGEAVSLNASADRSTIDADGVDLSFITVRITDQRGDLVPVANNLLTFSISGPGEIVATDNGDPTDFTAFPSSQRKAFNGLALAIVRTRVGESDQGSIRVVIEADGLEAAEVLVNEK